MTPKAVALPPNTDPDSYIQKEGVEAWNKLKEKALTLFEFFVVEVSKEVGSGTQAKLKAWEKIRPFFKMVKSSVEAGLYRKLIAEKLGVDEEELHKGAPKKSGQNNTKKEPKKNEFPEEERLLIAAMVLKPTLTPKIQSAGDIFTNPTLKETATQLFRAYAEEGSVTLASLQDQLDTDLSRWIREMALVEEDDPIWEKAVQDCLSRIEGKNLNSRLQILNKEIALAEEKGNEQELLKLLAKKTQLTAIRTKGGGNVL